MKTILFADSNFTCEEEEHTTNATQGVVKNLAYPSTDRSECTVRVKVPDDAYINVIIHDMERMTSGEECDGGLRLRTSRICNFDETFPRKTVCSFSGNMTVFQACGDVEIYMTPSKEGFRFYISYIGMTLSFNKYRQNISGTNVARRGLHMRTFKRILICDSCLYEKIISLYHYRYGTSFQLLKYVLYFSKNTIRKKEMIFTLREN